MSNQFRILDWKPSTHPEQNLRYRLAALDCYSGGSARASIRRTQALHLDQGREGACTGFGAAHVLSASPYPVPGVTEQLARELYYQARREDEWEGEDYDGSSVNGVMHAARTLGRIKSWHWATTAGELRHGLSYHGAAEAGSVWLETMFEPGDDGYLKVAGEEVGGHAYEIGGYRPAPARGATAVDYWIDNSWGPDWGHGGGAWLRDVDAYRLWFASDGEVAVPVKV
jgi:hypothetical protein